MLIQQALATAPLDAEDRTAAESSLLPLFDDLAYRYYLAADGAVFTRDVLVPEDGLRPMTDARQLLAVYRIAVEERPELGELIPARPAGLTDCGGCAGKGREAVTTVSGRPATTICPLCRGAGWIEGAVLSKHDDGRQFIPVGSITLVGVDGVHSALPSPRLASERSSLAPR